MQKTNILITSPGEFYKFKHKKRIVKMVTQKEAGHYPEAKAHFIYVEHEDTKKIGTYDAYTEGMSEKWHLKLNYYNTPLYRKLEGIE